MNQYQLYTGFIRAQKVYGQTSPHVQLIAKQLGVLAGEIVDYILAHPTLATIHYLNQKSGINNSILGEEYTGMYVDNVVILPFLTSESVIVEGATGATIVVDIVNDTFKNTTSEVQANWTIDVGETGLTFTTATKTSATKATLTFTGTVKRGTITIMCEKAGLVLGTVDSDIYSHVITNSNLDYPTIVALTARIAALEAVTPEVGEVVIAVAATGTLDMTATAPIQGNTVILGTKTYKFVETLGTTPGNILIEATSAGCIDNLVACIMGTAGDETKYVSGTGFNQSDALTAVRSNNTMVVTYATKGIIGNIPSAGTMTSGSWGAETLEDGTDGTPAAAGKVFIGDKKVAVAKAECTISNSDGWEFATYDVNQSS